MAAPSPLVALLARWRGLTRLWVTVALRTPPDDEATLREFVRRVRPLGAWARYREPGAAPTGGPGLGGRAARRGRAAP